MVSHCHNSIYVSYINNDVTSFYYCHDWINEYPDKLKLSMQQSLKRFNDMYPRWFTLFKYFKYNQDGIPLDVFNNMICYYIHIESDVI